MNTITKALENLIGNASLEDRQALAAAMVEWANKYPRTYRSARLIPCFNMIWDSMDFACAVGESAVQS